MKKYNYFSRVSGWGICMLFLLTGLFAGCSENEEVYPKGQRPSGIESVRKVACIGNSITYGARQFLNDREKECYPALLGNMLGEGFEVANFGCSGTTLLKNGNSPYWNTKEYTNAKAFLMIQSRAIGLVMAPSLSPISRIWFFPYGVCQLARGSFCVRRP